MDCSGLHLVPTMKPVNIEYKTATKINMKFESQTAFKVKIIQFSGHISYSYQAVEHRLSKQYGIKLNNKIAHEQVVLQQSIQTKLLKPVKVLTRNIQDERESKIKEPTESPVPTFDIFETDIRLCDKQ